MEYFSFEYRYTAKAKSRLKRIYGAENGISPYMDILSIIVFSRWTHDVYYNVYRFVGITTKYYRHYIQKRPYKSWLFCAVLFLIYFMGKMAVFISKKLEFYSGLFL